MRTVSRGHVEMTWNSVVPDDTSEYVCVARNRAGATETRAQLTVNCTYIWMIMSQKLELRTTQL